MDIYWGGQALFRLKGKNATVIIDPLDSEFTGLKLPKDLSADVVLSSHDHGDHNNTGAVSGLNGGTPMVFKDPGEYEVKGVVITGISSFHDNSEGSQRGSNTIFHLMFDGLDIVHLGDLGQFKLSEEQVVQIGQTDILFIPVGSVYTIDGNVASDIVSQLEPKIIIPMHYKIEGLKFELEGVEKFLKEMGAEGVMVQPKLSITKERLPEEPMVVVLSN
ncbi:MBL fold metallo-hydrolase [Candidatus Microgenomates bacterium]|nr:MBL fold metallo-hydrolase [Candidatus Microgenomates bacterium]